jgi:hypothetical protein
MYDGKMEPDFDSLIERFREPEIVAIVLMGSYARGEATEFSDIDLVRFYAGNDGPEEADTFLVGGHYVVVSNVSPAEVAAWFSEPEPASAAIAGVRSGKALWDPEGYFGTIQQQARVFVWDEEMQAKADQWCSAQMVGWIEEVQKGLAGLKLGDEGRLLNARFGLSWGMTKVMRVHRGILITGDNGSYPEVVRAVGVDSKWAILSRRAFGIGEESLAEQVQAGLGLYLLTAEHLAHSLQAQDKALVEEAVRRIRAEGF